MDWKELLFNEIKDLREESNAHSLASQKNAKEVEVRLQAIEKDLKYHIKRTDLLEENMKPVRNHVNGIHYIIKAVLLLGALAGAATKIMGVW
jgi:hypothetical protein